MKIQLGRRFWIVLTAVIVVFSVFVIGRNALHAVKIKRQINALERERSFYVEKIAQDSSCWNSCATTTISKSMPASITTCSGATNTSIFLRSSERASPFGTRLF